MPKTNSGALATAASITKNLIPSKIQKYITNMFFSYFARLSSSLTIVIKEYDGMITNKIFKSAKVYLATKLDPSTTRIRVTTKHDDSDTIDVKMDCGQEVVDLFQGVKFQWQLTSKESIPSRHRYKSHAESANYESRSFELTVHKKHKEIALNSYLPFVISQAKLLKEKTKTLKLYTNESIRWRGVSFKHLAKFEMMAMEIEQKKELIDDLERFMKRREYYKQVGKAWKRGYLLYGPPGTDKSSLVAAMANFLRFDVYDLELTEVKNNSSLRTLLIGIANHSILVVEDIDCAADLAPRKNKKGSKSKGDVESDSDDERVTLSGLLNFVYGLWSSCGDERIIIFTTNHKDRLDPALLRPGRMDMHIHISYRTPAGFRILALNYQFLNDHILFGEIEELIREVAITPAEIAEELMKSDDAEFALQGLVNVLKGKKEKNYKNTSLE